MLLLTILPTYESPQYNMSAETEGEGNDYAFKGYNSFELVALKRTLLYKEIIYTTGSKFFPFSVYPFSEGDLRTGKQTETRKNCLSCQI